METTIAILGLAACGLIGWWGIRQRRKATFTAPPVGSFDYDVYDLVVNELHLNESATAENVPRRPIIEDHSAQVADAPCDRTDQSDPLTTAIEKQLAKCSPSLSDNLAGLPVHLPGCHTSSAHNGTGTCMTIHENIHMSPAASQYKRRFGCTTWTAEALETLDSRDPLDGLKDVEALWASVYEHDHSKEWSRASTMMGDPATSYWLSAHLREAMEETVPDHLRAVTELLRIMRSRLDRVLGKASPTSFDSRSCPQCDD
jgi:hypothetical protein